MNADAEEERMDTKARRTRNGVITAKDAKIAKGRETQNHGLVRMNTDTEEEPSRSSTTKTPRHQADRDIVFRILFVPLCLGGEIPVRSGAARFDDGCFRRRISW
jgi:hypothetical protein